MFWSLLEPEPSESSSTLRHPGALWDRYGPRPAFLFGAGLAAAALAVVADAPGLQARVGHDG